MTEAQALGLLFGVLLVYGLWRLGPLPSSVIWSAAQTPILSGVLRQQSPASMAMVAIVKLVQRWPRFVASPATPLLRRPLMGLIERFTPYVSGGRGEQLSKLDVVVGNRAER